MKVTKNQNFKLKNKKIAIVYRIAKREAVRFSEETALWFKERGFQVFTAPEQKLLKNTNRILRPGDLRDISMGLVFGGDGTYLRAVRLFNSYQTPLLGFNMGSLGFLTPHMPAEGFELFEQAISGKLWIEPRSMIEVEQNDHNKFLALNDVVIERGSQSQLLNVSIFSDNVFVSQVRADGIIISTPSGSTAYNLSSGGPLVETAAPVVVVTPIAPHSLTSRPLIFSDKRKLSFKIEKSTPRAQLIVDGQRRMTLSSKDKIVINKSIKNHLSLRSDNYDFFTLLREKLKFGDR